MDQQDRSNGHCEEEHTYAEEERRLATRLCTFLSNGGCIIGLGDGVKTLFRCASPLLHEMGLDTSVMPLASGVAVERARQMNRQICRVRAECTPMFTESLTREMQLLQDAEWHGGLETQMQTAPWTLLMCEADKELEGKMKRPIAGELRIGNGRLLCINVAMEVGLTWCNSIARTSGREAPCVNNSICTSVLQIDVLSTAQRTLYGQMHAQLFEAILRRMNMLQGQNIYVPKDKTDAHGENTILHIYRMPGHPTPDFERLSGYEMSVSGAESFSLAEGKGMADRTVFILADAPNGKTAEEMCIAQMRATKGHISVLMHAKCIESTQVLLERHRDLASILPSMSIVFADHQTAGKGMDGLLLPPFAFFSLPLRESFGPIGGFLAT